MKVEAENDDIIMYNDYKIVVDSILYYGKVVGHNAQVYTGDDEHRSYFKWAWNVAYDKEFFEANKTNREAIVQRAKDEIDVMGMKTYWRSLFDR
jgi:hypothetical protein